MLLSMHGLSAKAKRPSVASFLFYKAPLALQGEKGHFYVTATAKPASKEISLEALEKRKNEIDKYLVHNSRPHRSSLSQAGSVYDGSQHDDTSVALTPQEQSLAPTPRTLSLTANHPGPKDSPTPLEGLSPDLSHQQQHSPRSGRLRGGFAFSDRPLLGGDNEDLSRSKSFSGQELRQMPSNLSVTTGRDEHEETTQAMRRSGAPHSLSSSVSLSGKARGSACQV